MKKLRAVISAFLVFCLISGTIGSFAVFADDGSWEKYKPSHYRYMHFVPQDKYVSMQNPPDFRWPNAGEGAVYELIVCSDPELKDVKYSQSGITTPFYQFPYTFETGVDYYWSVRHKINGTDGDWSQARRFRIDPNAAEYTVDDIDTILSRIPQGHPRIWTTPDNLSEFRALKDNSQMSKESFEFIEKLVMGYLESGEVPAEPEARNTFANSAEQGVYLQAIKAECQRAYYIYWYCGFYYMVTGNKEAGKLGVKALMEVSDWDINGVSSYTSQDQIHREIAYTGAMAYDWLYDLMTDAERKKALNMIRERTKVMEYLLDTLVTNPYDSHGWTAYGYIGIISIATYNEIPEAKDWLKIIIPGYSSILPPWGYQDGGWSQGTDYWQYSSNAAKEFMTVLLQAGVLDISSKAWQQNEKYWTMYAYPAGSYGSFGDQANRIRSDMASYTVESLAAQIFYTKDPQTKWLYEQQNRSAVNLFMYPMGAVFDKVKAEAPLTEPLSKEFNDIGWAVMTSSLTDRQRIQCTFKSSDYGSFNHSHADQNSFIIQAYGENLAIKSGYYDSYHTSHDSGFTRTTPAHNSVTVSPSKGQYDDEMTASGRLTNFISHADFDLVSGDASKAYNSKYLSKFERSMIYIRPDIFVVVDELEAPKNTPKKFEWWLNAEHPIKVYDGELTGARIQEGNAVLDAAVQYPQNTKAYYVNTFANSTMREYPAQGNYVNSNVHTRVWFETESLEKTKMIVTMDVHGADSEARYVDTESTDEYTRMIFEDGTVCIVNLGSSTDTVTADGITFTGTAVVYNDDTVMLVSGTELKWGDTTLIRSAKPMSLCMGKDEIGISTYEDNDISVNINNDYIDKCSGVTDYNGRAIGPELGITYESGMLTADGSVAADSEAVTLHAATDNYSLMLNGKRYTANPASAKLTVVIDGQPAEYEISGYETRSGETECDGLISIPTGKYVLKSKNQELSFGNIMTGQARSLSDVSVKTTAAENTVELETVPSLTVTAEAKEDFNAVRDAAAVLTEAEAADVLANGSRIYSTRTFLSGGSGVTEFNGVGTEAAYTVTIPEDGVYDFAVKYVAWLDEDAVRSVNINGVDYIFTLPKTAGWGSDEKEWRAAVTDSGMKLEAGTYTVTLSALGGSWNYDWFAFVKR